MTTPAGWHPDPDGSGGQRYFNGQSWTDLNLGDAIDTAVVFDVPVGTDPESIELHDGPFSQGVTVEL